jgi:DNA repair exonuclease SbcCD ATPase subunit
MNAVEPGAGVCADLGSRHRMIESVTIENFRCFAHLTAECAPINMVVGDNGVGKTTLLEAMFLTLW